MLEFFSSKMETHMLFFTVEQWIWTEVRGGTNVHNLQTLSFKPIKKSCSQL